MCPPPYSCQILCLIVEYYLLCIAWGKNKIMGHSSAFVVTKVGNLAAEQCSWTVLFKKKSQKIFLTLPAMKSTFFKKIKIKAVFELSVVVALKLGAVALITCSCFSANSPMTRSIWFDSPASPDLPCRELCPWKHFTSCPTFKWLTLSLFHWELD